jgi:predicted alpha/beta-fold hydrolase
MTFDIFGPINIRWTALPLFALAVAWAIPSASAQMANPATSPKAEIHKPTLSSQQVTFGSVKVNDLNIAYREAGDPAAPKLVLLHGFPASSHQYRNLIQALAGRFHVIAPDYQGFGNSDTPDPATYAYTFDGIALTIENSSPPRDSITTACSCRIMAARSDSGLLDDTPRLWIG